MEERVGSHILKELSLPDRYERLRARLGGQVANLLISPSKASLDNLQLAAREVLSRDEGILVPIQGSTGAGKTTFVMNVTSWLPAAFESAIQYDGALTFEDLVHTVRKESTAPPAGQKRIVPINVDHRENAPPSDQELAVLKRFLRTNAAGVPSIVFWPETSADIRR